MKPFRTLLLTAALTGALLTPAQAAGLTHTVSKGDTMWKIASKYQVGTSEIIQVKGSSFGVRAFRFAPKTKSQPSKVVVIWRGGATE